jgi:hypothetical protein
VPSGRSSLPRRGRGGIWLLHPVVHHPLEGDGGCFNHHSIVCVHSSSYLMVVRSIISSFLSYHSSIILPLCTNGRPDAGQPSVVHRRGAQSFASHGHEVLPSPQTRRSAQRPNASQHPWRRPRHEAALCPAAAVPRHRRSGRDRSDAPTPRSVVRQTRPLVHGLSGSLWKWGSSAT